MSSDYAAIREANKAEYGNVGRWGRDVLVNRYDSSAHFVFELLQNAEDALRRRIGWTGSRKVRFELNASELRVVHCGNPFILADVKGVCGVGETTKDLTDIGRFGIGFKSVYAITERPEVHSGDEDFAIDDFVFPEAVPPTRREVDETEFVLPLRIGDADLFSLISGSLSTLGARTLLFLREIDEITWSADGGASGHYIKEKAEESDDNSRRVTLVGQLKGGAVVEETWLVFSREASTPSGSLAGFTEIAFLLQVAKESKKWAVQHVGASPLCAFFPTVVTTNLGFLLQGPFRTTPSRDNVPPNDPWNRMLVRETGDLLVDALTTLKSKDLLDVAALQCLPIERTRFPEGSMFAPLYDVVRGALRSKPLLPRATAGWTAAKNARLARTQELRDLFDAQQLAALLELPEETHWLSGDITRDTAATLRNYLLYELNVGELTPELVLSRLTKEFLEAQPDKWILKLYEFLGGQSALVRQGRLSNTPLVRIEGGAHVVAELAGQPQAYLPSEIRTDFPIVPKAVCSTPKALQFLKALGLTEPEAVDDVVHNIVPKYMGDSVEVDDKEYDADLRRMLTAFGTQHRAQRDRLISALKRANFVRSRDAGDGSKHVSKPRDIYFATERLKELFAGVSGVMLVDDSYSCLKGEDVRELLDACGAARHLRPIPDNTLSWFERAALREQTGHAGTSGQNDQVNDYTLSGLTSLLEKLPSFTAEERHTKARLLWEELANLEERQGKGIFTGEYTWTHYGRYDSTFNAAFVRRLNEAAWVSGEDGDLRKPGVILFDSLGWRANPFLLSRIRFKPPIVDQLAKEAGIEPGVLDLLKKLGVTTEDDLRARLGVEKATNRSGDQPVGSVTDAVKKLIGDAPEATVPMTPPGGQDPVSSGAGMQDDGPATDARTAGERGAEREMQIKGDAKADRSSRAKRTPGGAGGPPFISYVGAHPEDEEPDPDGLDQAARMALEESAIDMILRGEPEWRRTPTHNPGFDLYQGNDQDSATRWCEVKSMTGRLADRPVGLSRTQFECARSNSDKYWLYVVECAGTDVAHLVRIQDPAGKARTFTFDHGWLGIAETDSEEDT